MQRGLIERRGFTSSMYVSLLYTLLLQYAISSSCMARFGQTLRFQSVLNRVVYCHRVVERRALGLRRYLAATWRQVAERSEEYE